MAGVGQGVALTGDQFYVTHCATADSVMNAPGYSVRASSVAGDPDALRLALEYPPYELPLEMWKEKPTRASAPRRLSRTRHRESGVWVVHSVYLEKDTMNRDRSYFSHLLQLPATTDAAAVLESWGAAEWATEYAPGAPKVLRKGKLPAGELITRESLRAFLAEDAPSGPTALSVAVCPARLRGSAEARRELVARFLQAYLVTFEAKEAGEQRDRLFVHAEPGLVAMLLYAAVSILPQSYTADLTFSTFEPSHRGVRDFKLATVIGTYLGGTNKGLDIDLTATRGYGLDTIVPARSTKQFTGAVELPPELAELLDLAAGGEWELLGDVHRLVHGEADPVSQVPHAVPLARAVRRLDEGTVAAGDLLALKADRRGDAILQREADKVWAHLRDAALTDELLRTGFRDWLANPDRLAEYRREAAACLVRGDLDGWDERWAIIRDSADRDERMRQADQARKSLDDEIPNMPQEARDRLRSACAESGAWPDHHLLAPTGPPELEALLAPDIPPEWQGYACFAVMAPEEKNWLAESTRPYRAVMRERVRRFLMTAPAAVLGGYLQQARPYVSSDPVFIHDLLRPHRPECVGFLSRLIDGGASRIAPADWVKLLGELDVYGSNSPQWEGFLLKNDHLAKLLTAFKADPSATSLWDGYLALISADLLDGDEWEKTVYAQLAKAKEALDAARVKMRLILPTGGEEKLYAADAILSVMAKPSSAESLDVGQLASAFQTFGLSAVEGLRKVYFRGKFDTVDVGEEPEKLAGFVAAFRSCFPITHEYNTARTAVTQWVALSESCPDETRAAFQLLFIRDCVPANWHQAILDETRQHPLLPETEARVRELILAARKPTTQYARSSEGRAARTEDDSGYVSQATRRAKRSKGGRGRGKSGGNGKVWLVVVFLVLAAVIAVIVVMKKGS